MYQTYATGARGVEFLMGYYGILDRAPKGRDEGDASSSGSGDTTSTSKALTADQCRNGTPPGDIKIVLAPAAVEKSPRRAAITS